MKLRMDDLTWQEIDGELVILDLQGSVYLTTNAAGAFLTKLLTEERSEGELTDALIAEYRIDRETAERDVDAFVAQLKDQNLLA
ncbi:PqqD family protein [Pseudactinotalea sp. Z1748]|uniref:PqqD family protein n=1 Tax=Pseudactinotalea sp. Z1748 TaxID=3413027 RepID=UPI003C7E432F